MHNHIYGAHIEEFVQSYFPYEYHASSPVLRFESEVHDHEKAPISVAEEVDEDSGEKKYQIRVACIYTPGLILLIFSHWQMLLGSLINA